MKYLRCVIGILTVVCLLVTAAACGSEKEPPQTESESRIESQTEPETSGTGDDTPTFMGNPVYPYSPPEEVKAEQERRRQLAQEKNEQALAGEYAAVDPEKCVGRFQHVAHVVPELYLYDDGTFDFLSLISSRKTQISGTWRVEGNELITEVGAVWPTDSEPDPKKPEDIRLFFEFLNEDVLVFHPDRSSDLSDFMIGFNEDTAFIRGEMPDLTE